jgi:hypothetical protein
VPTMEDIAALELPTVMSIESAFSASAAGA